MLGFEPRTARVVWTAMLMAVLFYAIYVASGAIVVCVFAVFFSYLVYPLVELVERVRPKRLPRAVSIAVVFCLVVLAVVAAAILFGSQVEEQAVALSQRLPTQISAQNVADKIPLPNMLEPMRERMMDFVRSQLANGTDQAMPLARKFGEGLVSAASNLIYILLVPILSFLMMIEAPAIKRELLALLGNANKRLWSAIIFDLDVLLAKYVRAVLILALLTLVAYGVAFWLLDVPYSLLLAGLAALLEFVPFAGPLAAIVVTFVVTVFSGHDNLIALAVFFAAYRLFQDYVINPYLMSEGVEVSPLLVIVGLLVGDKLGGIVGIFLSVPIMAAIKIIAVRLTNARRHRELALAENARHPVLTPEVAVNAPDPVSPLSGQIEAEQQIRHQQQIAQPDQP